MALSRVLFPFFLIYKVAQLEKLRGLKLALFCYMSVLCFLSPLLGID